MDEKYTLTQLRDLDDAAQAGGFGEVMEARFARDALGAETIGVSLQRLKPAARGAFGHRHHRDEEIYVVVSGSGRALVDDEIVELGPWSALRVAPDAVRAFEAGEHGLEFLAFGTHTEDDAAIVDADWPA